MHHLTFQTLTANQLSASLPLVTMLDQVITARYLKINPQSWENGINMKVEFIGRPAGMYKSVIIHMFTGILDAMAQ